MSEDKGVDQRELATCLSSAFMLAIQDLGFCKFVLEARIQRERPYKPTRLSLHSVSFGYQFSYKL